MYSIVDKIARLFALLGGVVLFLIIVLTCVSILGRSINSILHSDFFTSELPGLSAFLLGMGIGPVNGDYELVEAGMAFAIFAFLPICQLHGAHASVDIFTSGLSPKTKAFLQMVIEVVFAAVMVLVAYQLFLGMMSKLNSGQTSFLLQMPVWWAYAASLLGAVMAAFVAVYMAVIRIFEFVSGQQIQPLESGSGG